MIVPYAGLKYIPEYEESESVGGAVALVLLGMFFAALAEPVSFNDGSGNLNTNKLIPKILCNKDL